jgi:hypothetical protein
MHPNNFFGFRVLNIFGCWNTAIQHLNKRLSVNNRCAREIFAGVSYESLSQRQNPVDCHTYKWKTKGYQNTKFYLIKLNKHWISLRTKGKGGGGGGATYNVQSKCPQWAHRTNIFCFCKDNQKVDLSPDGAAMTGNHNDPRSH